MSTSSGHNVFGIGWSLLIMTSLTNHPRSDRARAELSRSNGVRAVILSQEPFGRRRRQPNFCGFPPFDYRPTAGPAGPRRLKIKRARSHISRPSIGPLRFKDWVSAFPRASWSESPRGSIFTPAIWPPRRKLHCITLTPDATSPPATYCCSAASPLRLSLTGSESTHGVGFRGAR